MPIAKTDAPQENEPQETAETNTPEDTGLTWRRYKVTETGKVKSLKRTLVTGPIKAAHPTKPTMGGT